jgi:arginine decarboxylase
MTIYNYEMKFMVIELIETRLIPKNVFFTVGVGVHEDDLISFALALKNAGIKDFNLVRVNSAALKCGVIDKKRGLSGLKRGQIVYCVMAKMTSNEAGRTIYASIGVAIPDNTKLNGYFVEDHGYCEPNSMDAGKRAEATAAYLLESSCVKAAMRTNVVAKACVEKGKYTTVVAAAIFVM